MPPMLLEGFPGGSVCKESTRNAGAPGLIPELARSPREENGNPLQYSCLENPMDSGAWWAIAQRVGKSQTQLSNFTFTFHFHALEKVMAIHSSTLAWRIPWTQEPGGLQSVGSLRVRHDFSERLHFHFSLSYIGEGKGNPLQCSCLENPRDREAWWAAVYGVAQSWT